MRSRLALSQIDYTSHAKTKFALLKRYGFEVTPNQVNETVLNPDTVTPQLGGKFTAQKAMTTRHVLRAIFREEGEKRVVITFYPGRKERYETEL